MFKSDVKYEKWPEGNNDDSFEEPRIPGDSDKECDSLNKLGKNGKKCTLCRIF